ncbi:MAG: STAS domain-containing protein [Acidimicrobiales bacterium]
MQLEKQRSGEWLVLSLRGDVDLSTLPSLRSEFARLVQRGEIQIVLDLDRVDLLGPLGLGLFLDLVWRTRTAGGDCRIVTTVERYKDLFAVTRLDHALIVEDSLSAATHAPPFT